MKTSRLLMGGWPVLFSFLPVLALIGVGQLALADEGEVEVHTVKREPFMEKVTLDGVFEARRMREIKVEPEVFTSMEILEVVEHGEPVDEGDMLVRLDLSELREQIEEAETAQKSGALALAAAEDELKHLEQTTPLRLAAAQRAMRLANEDYAYFEETDRTEKENAAHFNLKSSEQRLEGAREELNQLEQMYKADDLTEETEEIVLKRQRYAVESAEYYHQRTKLGNRRLLETLIPREHEGLKAAKLDQDLAYALAEKSLPRSLEQKRMSVAKMRRDHEKSGEKLADLKKDRRRLNVRATMDGIVYYGQCVDGKWATGAAMAKKLRPGGKLTPKEVIMTIVDPNDLIVRLTVGEDKVGQLRKGQAGQASPVVFPDRDLKAELESLSLVPLPGASGFAATATVEAEEGVRLMPGMNCKLSFPGTKTSDALSVPRSAVFEEGGEQCVYLAKEEGDPERKAVKLGRDQDERVEVVEGLSEGDRILLEKP